MMKSSSLLTIAVSVVLVSPRAQAAAVIGGDGVDMGYSVTGRIYNMRPLVLPSANPVAYPSGWLTLNKGLAKCVAPISNFIGQMDDGTPMAYVDLIPLTTSGMFVVGSSGDVILDAYDGGTILGGKVTLLEPQGDISMGIYQ